MSAWSRREVEATVTGYLYMLGEELSGRQYSKTQTRRRVLPFLNGRTESALEFKFANISAALIDLGFPYVEGYKPRSNYQQLLLHCIVDQLMGHTALRESVAADAHRDAVVPLHTDVLAALVPAPAKQALKTVRKRGRIATIPGTPDYFELEARNRSLGGAGEEFAIQFEHARLDRLGKGALAAKIEHVARTRGDSEGFDILSFEMSGAERFIEVKTTKYGKYTPFFVSRNELRISCDNPRHFYLYRVFNFRESPRLFMLAGRLSASAALDPVSYVARVG